jgi:phosphatidylcholine synthase
VALCVYILSPAPWLTFITVICLALLTVTRMKFLHPFRVRRFMPLNIAVTAVWFFCSFLLVMNHPYNASVTLSVWLAMSAYFLGICIWRTSMEWIDKARV